MKKNKMKLIKAKIKLLALTKELIINKKREFICWTLEEALTIVNEDVRLRKIRRNATAYFELRTYIEKSLDGHHSLEYWLQSRNFAAYRQQNQQKRLQETRVVWIDWMIQCLNEDLTSKSK